ncbi:hypothetical protein [Lacticaseibacillus nasuensis]|uniref:hypothetical protein n=1 Tax=Lacticaseibacillus nasuensis TaxID=944671 RepID=UPI0006D1C0EB|nr:hypothetical protein [Lacticaseibacillus nasuensis]
MTVTIGDCLRLPALRGANLLTDARGLDWPVTAVSVLEYSEVTPIQQTLVDQIHYQATSLCSRPSPTCATTSPPSAKTFAG